MTTATWPAALPRPERNTWSRSHQDARLKRKSDAGPPTWRRRFSSAAQMVSLSVLLTRDQNAIFENFFRIDVNQGARLFWMPDPTTDGWPLLDGHGNPILISGGPDDGKPILLAALWLCSIGDQLPEEAIVGTQFRRSFSVVVMP